MPEHPIEFYLPNKSKFIKENPIASMIKSIEKQTKTKKTLEDHY